MYTHEYDTSYQPALPMVELQVRPITQDTGGVSIRALIDSGADATVLPSHILHSAGVEQVGRARMRWGSHQSQPYDVYLATIRIGDYTIYGVRVLATTASNEAILGRDVLNQLIVTLNGLAHVTEISD